jgi:hypothetical protein
MDRARKEGLKEITLFTAIPQKVEGMIWCKAFGDIGEKGECGRQCDLYEPKNGKSGMCKNQGKFYEPNKEVTFKVISAKVHY